VTPAPVRLAEAVADLVRGPVGDPRTPAELIEAAERLETSARYHEAWADDEPEEAGFRVSMADSRLDRARALRALAAERRNREAA